MSHGYSNLFYANDTAASGSENTTAVTWDANTPYAREVTLKNDGSVNLLYRFSLNASQATLKPGETIHHEIAVKEIYHEGVAGTVAWRAWGIG